MAAGRSGHRWRVLQANQRAKGLPCWICHEPIDYSAPPNDPESFEPDHYYPVSTHPHLAQDPGNLRSSHCKCNRERGNRAPPTGVWVRSEF